jgi:hypothetical protein
MLDFKQESSSIRETLQLLADTVVCLANAHGGTIILGVADKPVTGGSFVGVSPALSVDTVIRGIHDRTARSSPFQWRNGTKQVGAYSSSPCPVVRQGPTPRSPVTAPSMNLSLAYQSHVVLWRPIALVRYAITY